MAADKALRLQMSVEATPEAADQIAKIVEEGNRRAGARAQAGLATTPDFGGGATPAAISTKERALQRLGAAQAKLAREARAAALAELPAQEQLNRLLRRREEITGRLVDAEGNAYRTAVLRLGAARLDSAIGSLRPQGGAAPEPGGLSTILQSYILRRELLRSIGVGGVAGNLGARALGGLAEGGAISGGVAMLGAGALAAGSFIAAVAKAAKAGHEITRSGAEFNLPLRDVQRLKFSATSTGNDPGQLLESTDKLRELSIAARAGDPGSMGKLLRAGIDPDQDPTSQLLGLSDRVRSGRTHFGAARDIVGAGGMPALASGLSEAAHQFERLGLALSNENIQTLEAFWLAVKNATAVLGAGFIKGAGSAVEGLQRGGNFIADRLLKPIVDNYAVRNVVRFGNDADSYLKKWLSETLGLLRSGPGGVTKDSRGNLVPIPGSAAAPATISAETAEERERKIRRQADDDAIRAKRDAEADDLRNENDARFQRNQPLRDLANRLIATRDLAERDLTTPGSISDRLEREKRRREYLDANDQLASLAGRGDTSGQVRAGGLAAVGLFQGVSGSDLQNLEKQQLQVQREIVAAIHELPGGIAGSL